MFACCPDNHRCLRIPGTRTLLDLVDGCERRHYKVDELSGEEEYPDESASSILGLLVSKRVRSIECFLFLSIKYDVELLMPIANGIIKRSELDGQSDAIKDFEIL